MGVMNNIKREINTNYIVNLLDNYILYQKKHYLTEEEKNNILKFIIFLMYEGEIFDE